MKNLRNFLLIDMQELRYIVEEINGWNGSLEYLQVYENNEDFFEYVFYGSKYDLARKIKEGDYRLEDDLVRFDCYEDLETLDEWEYQEELENNIDDIIEKLIDCYDNLDLSDELIALIVEAE